MKSLELRFKDQGIPDDTVIETIELYGWSNGMDRLGVHTPQAMERWWKDHDKRYLFNMWPKHDRAIPLLEDAVQKIQAEITRLKSYISVLQDQIKEKDRKIALYEQQDRERHATIALSLLRLCEQ